MIAAKIKAIKYAIFLVGGLFLLILFGVFFAAEEEEASNEPSGGGGQVVCSIDGEIDEGSYNQTIENGGVFAGYQEKFLEEAEKQGIDPVLFAGIALHETAHGTSRAVVERNNPGGLMHPDGSGLMNFSSLEEGIESMGNTLHNRIIQDGLTTIEDLGAVYAPIGADNDPTGLNENWVPTTETIVKNLGGLTMNCEPEEIEHADGEFVNPMGHMNTTSEFGMRVHPIHGTQKMHNGLDFGCNNNDDIMAAMNGEVVQAEWSGGYGNTVMVDHGGMHTLYAHMSVIDVSTGDTVSAGERVGGCGTTGDSTGNHLHFEVHEDGFRQGHTNPRDYLEG